MASGRIFKQLSVLSNNKCKLFRISNARKAQKYNILKDVNIPLLIWMPSVASAMVVHGLLVFMSHLQVFQWSILRHSCDSRIEFRY